MSAAERVEDRIDVAGRIDAVLLHGEGEPTIQVMNLSNSGAALRAQEPIGAVMDRAELRMRRADDGDWVSCPCQLRYILGENRPDGEPAWLHGVHFTDMPRAVQDFIRSLLSPCAPA